RRVADAFRTPLRGVAQRGRRMIDSIDMSAPPTQLPSGAPPPLNRLWWAVPATTFVLLIALAMLLGQPPETSGYGTSYDASDGGFRAVYLLLDELGYPVERSRRPTGGAVRWVLFPEKTTEKDTAALGDWVRRGNRAL